MRVRRIDAYGARESPRDHRVHWMALERSKRWRDAKVYLERGQSNHAITRFGACRPGTRVVSIGWPPHVLVGPEAVREKDSIIYPVRFNNKVLRNNQQLTLNNKGLGRARTPTRASQLRATQ